VGTFLCAFFRWDLVDRARRRALLVKVRRWVREGWAGGRKDILQAEGGSIERLESYCGGQYMADGVSGLQ